MTSPSAHTSYKGYRFKSSQLPTPLGKRISARADHTGKRFGRAVALECLGNEATGYKWWGLVCDCGTQFAARSRELSRGHTRSCGCLQRENQRTWGGVAGSNKLPVGHASRNELLASYVKSATSRGYKWALSNEHFVALIDAPCTYCGCQKTMERKPNQGVNGAFWYTGIDRVDNTRGYEPDNVVPCCWVCNRAKSTMLTSEFEDWIARLVAHQSARFEHGESPDA